MLFFDGYTLWRVPPLIGPSTAVIQALCWCYYEAIMTA